MTILPLTDQLDARGISWRYYTPSAGLLWTGPNAIQHICGPNNTPPNATACVGSDWVNDVVLNQKQVLTDITGGQLPSISWVIPDGASSDHAGLGDQGLGPSWVASIVNAVGTSSLIGPIPPSSLPGTIGEAGTITLRPKSSIAMNMDFSVPLIVVSPYAKAWLHFEDDARLRQHPEIH